MSVQELIDVLRPYSTCDISDALTKLGCPYGGSIPSLSVRSPLDPLEETKLIGLAYTVEYHLVEDQDQVDPDGSKRAFLKDKHYIDTIPKNHIVYISGPPGPQCLWGGIMTTRSQYLGALGTIINGNVRDVAEHHQAQYTIFSKGVGTCSPNGIAFCSAVGQEIQVGETGGSVRMGDVLVGDLNGVVCIPRELVQAVVDMVPGLVKVDEAIMERVKQGVSVHEAFKARKGKA